MPSRRRTFFQPFGRAGLTATTSQPIEILIQSTFFVSHPNPSTSPPEQPQRDPSTGCCITLFSACKHNPLSSSHQVTLQNIVLQLDVCISRVDAQNNGILFIYNMNNSKYANFDYELSQKILALLKGKAPRSLASLH